MARRLGLLVNPIAGMGGPVALKGTDDPEEARRLGADPVTPDRARRFVEAVLHRAPDVHWVTAGAPMGEDVLQACGEPAMVAYAPTEPTTPEDTREAARALRDAEVELLVFVGGDGTAADIVDGVDASLPVLGVPGGVKMYSGVFAGTPEEAATVALSWDGTSDREVLDIDEDAYRRDDLQVDLHGVLRVPTHRLVQAGKEAGASEDLEREALAQAAADLVRDAPGVTHVLGPGTTLGAVKAALGFQGTLLGFDVWRDGDVVARDAAAPALLQLPTPVRIWLAPLGGQGFVLGRGNQQVTPDVLRRAGPDAIRVLATPGKLRDLDGLRVDTGDPDLDAGFPRHLRVRTGPGRERLVRVRQGVQT